MRKWVLLIATILVMGALAGCLGGEAENKKDKAPELTMKRGTIETQEGWLQASDEVVSAAITLNLNDTNIVSVTIKISIEDSNAENAQTDQGSDPDDVTVTISGGNETTEQQGVTPFSFNADFRAAGGDGEDAVYLGQSWNIQVNADCNGGKPVYFFGFIVYLDQGVAYTLEGEYSYMAEEVTT